MLIKILTLQLLTMISMHLCNAQAISTPDKLYGQLFIDVQTQQIFEDGKTFVDCIPKRPINTILSEYLQKKNASFDLKQFVEDNFTMPPAPPQLNYIQQEKEVSMHIKNLWTVLRKGGEKQVKAGNSLLPLPYPYIVPGGRFREIHYWDSYFTMLGLKESGEIAMMENMVKNFAYLINKYGHIPTGNRSYYLSRSQPPFFCMMVELLASVKGTSVYKTYLPAMEKEYGYWMLGADKLEPGEASKRSVRMKDGSLLNRYWDDADEPRQESYKEDKALADAAANELAKRIRMSSPEALKKVLNDSKIALYRNLRAGAASGWDFSSRWFADGQDLAAIQTTEIIPVDLNCLLYAMELNIAKAKQLAGNKKTANAWLAKAIRRKAAIQQYCWNNDLKFFVDYNIIIQQQPDRITAAGLFPLTVGIATQAQADAVAATVKVYLLKEGGLVTTTKNTGQQWDAPNGWAPLQWMAVKGLNKCRQQALAKDIAQRWLSLNEKVYAATGKLLEKYNVEDLTNEPGGEYPSQDGFGWTNGVYLALKKLYPAMNK